MTASTQNRLTAPVAIGIVVSVLAIVAALGVIIANINDGSPRWPDPPVAGPDAGGPTTTTTTTNTAGTTAPGSTRSTNTGSGTNTTAPTGTSTSTAKTVSVTLGTTVVKIVQPAGYNSMRVDAKRVVLSNGSVSLDFRLTQRTAAITAIDAALAQADSSLRSTTYSQVERSPASALTSIGSTNVAVQKYRAVWTPTGAAARNESGLFVAGVKADGLTLHTQIYGSPGTLDTDKSWTAVYAQAYTAFANA